MLLRCRLFGPQVCGVDSCGKCGALLDVTFDLGSWRPAMLRRATPVTVRC